MTFLADDDSKVALVDQSLEFSVRDMHQRTGRIEHPVALLPPAGPIKMEAP